MTMPISVSHGDATGGELELVRGRGVVNVTVVDAEGRSVTLVFDESTFGDLVADAAGMWRAAHHARRSV